ncbi:hypothetical protein [Bosea sp. FBZP-16]|uniref:hypothetical protein n=1 Tax=Bosea sp. FBZP-16 TaxID=2065382 RepID=UPI001319C9F4|nr:hypothetical protein [Bosea sp. FBZP-16]
MNRRSFFALVPATVLAPVAAASVAAVGDGHFVPDDTPYVDRAEFRKMVSSARSTRGRDAIRLHRSMEEVIQKDGWVLRYPMVDTLVVNGRAVAISRSPTF